MQPLEGLLVVSIEQALAAPLCTARLADAGARVIKIERAEGDFARGYDKAAEGSSSYFTWTNHGKESVALDFRQAPDAALLADVIARADVFIQNLAPGAMARAGFGSAELRRKHPHLITVDITGYGESEAVRHLKAYDFLIQAESGLTSISGGVNEIGRIGVSICDIGAGMTAHGAILEALLRRKRTGDGSAIAVSLFDVAAEWMTVPLIHEEYGTGAPTRVGLQHPSMAPYGAFRTGDDALTLISVQNDREWARFCTDVLADSDLADDPRFATNNARVAHRDELDGAINAVTGALTKDEFTARLATANIAFGAVNSVAELGAHPALRRRPIGTDTGATISVPAAPVRWLDHPGSDAIPTAPAIGADTDHVREEFATQRHEEAANA